MQGLDEYIETIASAITNRETYQRMLGQIALEVNQTFGIKALETLASEIKERHGKSISPTTLRNYMWVEQKTGHLEIPDDISYRTRQAIAGSVNPEEWIEKIKQGYSSGEIFNMIMGKTDKEKCPTCGRLLKKKG